MFCHGHPCILGHSHVSNYQILFPQTHLVIWYWLYHEQAQKLPAHNEGQPAIDNADCWLHAHETKGNDGLLPGHLYSQSSCNPPPQDRKHVMPKKKLKASLSSHMVTEMLIFQISGNHVCQIWWILPQKHQCGKLLHKIIHEEKSDL
jgi:hypothetical protein